MKTNNLFCLTLLLFICSHLYAIQLKSIYQQKPDDSEAVFFTEKNFSVRADGKTDISDALQQAINKLKKEKNFGILFIPEGKYLISKTIYIPSAIRLIGYGKNRPEFILASHAPGFQNENVDDKGKAHYMFWFTGGLINPGQKPWDANAGTFYSAMSNINLRIGEGNPYAVALRTHYAQHCFVSYMSIQIGSGKAGIFDVGNEMENVAFFGGDYGIYTTKASPGWPVMMVDSYFEGQRKAAIRCQESGLAMVNLNVKDVPVVFDIEKNYWDKLYVENSRFENISKAAVIIANENNSNNQITFRHTFCKNVPVLALFLRSNTKTEINDKIYEVESFDHGLQMKSMVDKPHYQTNLVKKNLSALPQMEQMDIPLIPDMSTWVNIKNLGAKGDGIHDDTEIIQSAINKYRHIYFPEGWYLITKTLKMKSETKLIGLHPFATQLKLSESSPWFSGFGGPKALLESSQGGSNMLCGIGINTGGYNYRAVGVKWMANSKSYINDVKFLGGHGGLWRPKPNSNEKEPSWEWKVKISSPDNPVTEQGKDLAWDNQYWSLWVTDNGGGTFKDIWTASTYASSGFYANNTNTSARIYAMSIEHHVRNEVRFNKVSNWKIYCMQTEEESRESMDCQPIEIDDCQNLTFANLYMFRVIRINKPYHSSVRIRNCRNIDFLNLHNYSQIKYTSDFAVIDASKGIEVKPWELSQLIITGNEKREMPLSEDIGKLQKLATGFEFAEGLASDIKGNAFFCDARFHRIYKWNVTDNSLSLISDFPWEPSCLAFDSLDNLLVLFKYKPQPGFLIDGKPEEMPIMKDAGGTSFSGYGNSNYTMRMYSINTNDPENTIKLLNRTAMNSINKVSKALYPSNRWRDFHDFNEVSVYAPQACFLASDSTTIIPHYYDLARCSSLIPAIPGKPFYTSNEYDGRMVKMDVSDKGLLSNLTYFVEQGEFGSAVDYNGNVYVAAGDIYVYDPKGNQINVLQVPERPSALQFGGRDGKTLFITTRSSLYSIRIK